MEPANNKLKAIIRPYLPADKPVVLELLRLNTPGYFSPNEEADLADYLEHHREQYFIVEQEGNPVGCGGINIMPGHTEGRISWDILHPAYQGKGLGMMLLQHRLNILTADARVTVIVVRTSQMAYAFYERAGFELTSVVKDYWAAGFDLYHMEYRYP